MPQDSRFIEYQQRIAQERMAARACRNRARYDLAAYAEALHHDAEAARLQKEYEEDYARRQAEQEAERQAAQRPRRPRRNPIAIGKQPTMFADDDLADVLADWRTLSPAEIERAVSRGKVPTEDWDEMQAASELAASVRGIRPLLDDGVNAELAYALGHGLMDRLEEVYEAGREERIQPLVDYIRSFAQSEVEHETEREGLEAYVDSFQSYLESRLGKVADEVRGFLEEDDYARIDEVTEEVLEEVIADPDLYSIAIEEDPYNRDPRAVWSGRVGVLHHEVEGAKYSPELARILDGIYDNDLEEVEKQLHNHSPYVSFTYTPRSVNDLYRSFGLTISEAQDWRIAFIPKMDAIIAALEEKLGEGPSKGKGPEKYDVVYRYIGTNDTPAGASAQGMFVAALRPGQLKAVGAALGICVGREDMGYRRRLTEGKIRLYGIFTEAGKPKFCIEQLVSTAPPGSANAIGDIYQVKGKANRLPGFEPNKDELTKPDEVRLVVEFLMQMQFSVRQIAQMRDIGPGVRTMLENGIDPSLPPPVGRRRLPPAPTAENPGLRPSPATAAMIREDYAHPWGGRWGT